MYCYLEFKLSYLKNLKLFSIRVKELFEPIVLQKKKKKKKKKRDRFLLFLKEFSWETYLWVTLDDFTVKKKKTKQNKTKKTFKIGKGNLKFTENRLSRNELWCAVVNYNYMCHICAEGFLDSNFNQAIINKISNFRKIAPTFTYSWKPQYYWKEIDELLLLPYTFYIKTK